MFSESERLWMQDILDNIVKIERYAGGLDFEAYLADELVGDAVERCLSRISEAVVRIGPDRARPAEPRRSRAGERAAP